MILFINFGSVNVLFVNVYTEDKLTNVSLTSIILIFLLVDDLIKLFVNNGSVNVLFVNVYAEFKLTIVSEISTNKILLLVDDLIKLFVNFGSVNVLFVNVYVVFKSTLLLKVVQSVFVKYPLVAPDDALLILFNCGNVK
jgi:hypothetical protein